MDSHGISPFWESSRSTYSAEECFASPWDDDLIDLVMFCQVKQIVGGTLKEDSDSLITNFEANQCRSQVLASAQSS